MKFFTLFTAFITGAQCLSPIVGYEKADPESATYIVVLKKELSNAAFDTHVNWASAKLSTLQARSTPRTFNTGTFKAYTLTASKSAIATLAKNSDIDYIELDQIYTLPPVKVEKAARPRAVQANAPWGLARISHRQRGSTDYVYQQTTGTYVYVLDTGVRTQHQLFQGRATCSYSAVGGACNDVNGHGTHVAGIASSQTYGVVRFANIVGVKVLDDSGSSSTSIIISGINWAVNDIKTRGLVGRATGLLALGGGKSAALNAAVASAANSGVMFAVVAGNENANAGNFSPASEPTACTVGGTTIADAAMSTSNWGPVVDIYAPGQQIPSLWITSNTAINTLSGTSMAAAHIAGLGAYFLALEGPRGAVALCERMREVATPNVLTGIPTGTSNLLAYNLSGL